MRPRPELTFGSLFSGIGGFDLGFERAGMKCLWQVEIDEKCNQVLAKHWPEVKRYRDVKKIGASHLSRGSDDNAGQASILPTKPGGKQRRGGGSDTGDEDGNNGKNHLEPVDLICGGFPCQDLSVAGKRAGLAGERSGLWYEFARVIDELGPRWVVIENVPGLLSSNRGADFAVILRWLAERGYGVAWRVLDAQYFGVAQRRRRVFIVGSLGDGRAAEVLFEREGVRWNPPARGEEGKGIAGYTPTSFAGYSEGIGSLRADGGDYGGGSETLVMAHGQANAEILEDQSPALSLNHEAPIAIPINTMAATRPEGADENRQTFGVGENGDPMFTLQENHSHAVAFNLHQNDDGRKDRPNGGLYVTEAETALTQQTGEGKSKTLIAFSAGQSSGARSIAADENVTPPIRGSASGTNQMPTVAWEMSHANEAVRESGDIAPTLQQRMGTGGNQVLLVGVRRLTPVECERLQGFPDGWTDGQADSARYRQLGNAVAVPVAEWIGRRIVELEVG